MILTTTKSFSKDLKKLTKRLPTLDDDLNVFIKTALFLRHKHQIDNNGIVQIPGFPFKDPQIFKAKKFACRSLKGKGVRSGIRIIYAYFAKENKIELIEIYYKDSDHRLEDKKRILSLYG